MIDGKEITSVNPVKDAKKVAGNTAPAPKISKDKYKFTPKQKAYIAGKALEGMGNTLQGKEEEENKESAIDKQMLGTGLVSDIGSSGNVNIQQSPENKGWGSVKH